MDDKKYETIARHYESCLERYGDTHLGVDWPNERDAETRYEVMLGLTRPSESDSSTLLDFGCGASHLYEYMLRARIDNIVYAGLDLSDKFVRLSAAKFPSIKYYCLDILDEHVTIPHFDYIVMNGVFTEKRDLSFDDMFSYFKRVTQKLFLHANRGMAFNVMSNQVDWKREDLFHLPLDTLAGFLTRELTRKFVIRNDYGLYEYTTYVYK